MFCDKHFTLFRFIGFCIVGIILKCDFAYYIMHNWLYKYQIHIIMCFLIQVNYILFGIIKRFSPKLYVFVPFRVELSVFPLH